MQPPPGHQDNRLYGISLRPQELALYGEAVRFGLRYDRIDEGEEPNQETWLLVLSITCDQAPDLSIGRTSYQELELLKCGWQLTLAAGTQHQEASLRYLLAHIINTVNELGQRAGIDELLSERCVEMLLSAQQE